MASAQQHSSGTKRGRKSRSGPTRLAAVLIILAALPILGSGIWYAAIELEAFGAKQAAAMRFVGRVQSAEAEKRMRAQLLVAAAKRPTRARLEWVSGVLAVSRDELTEMEIADTAQFLATQLARNPSSHPAWARLTRLEEQRENRPVSARLYRAAYETGAYVPSSAIWAIAMGQRDWLYLDRDMQSDVQNLTYDLFKFAPAATSTIAGPKWREIYMRAALAHDPAAVRLFERYLTLYFDPAYNRQ